MSSHTASTGTTAEDYGKRYYAHYSDTDEPYSWESPGWRAWFTMVARRIVDVTGPSDRVLDVGCARGLLVQAFVEVGCDAHGIDLSDTSIGQASPEVRDRLEVASATTPIEGEFDLVTCIEVLEHMSPADAESAIDNICAVTSRVVLSSTPGDFDEATHINVHPIGDWAAAFASRGFYRRTDVDLGFITPWAIYFEKAPLSVRDVVHRYESQMYPMRLELNEKRAGLLEAHRLLSSSVQDEEMTELRHRLLVNRDYVMGVEAELGTARSERDEARREVRDLHERLAGVYEALAEQVAELEAVKASQRWRVGGAIVGPAATITGRRRR